MQKVIIIMLICQMGRKRLKLVQYYYTYFTIKFVLLQIKTKVYLNSISYITSLLGYTKRKIKILCESTS